MASWITLLIFFATLFCGVMYALDELFFKKHRGPSDPIPTWIDLPKSCFTVLLFVFVLRSFAFEPFKIPSSSMRPTLVVGDFILVNKFAYGLRLPIIDKKIVPIGEPVRGDVVVFRAPHAAYNNPADEPQDYIKRLIGLPGDTVVYRDKKLSINGTEMPQSDAGTYTYANDGSQEVVQTALFNEDLQTVKHQISVRPNVPPFNPGGIRIFPDKENCVYEGNTAFTCKVPEGHYFVMGDNRDNSDDGRYWGFVPDDHLRGKAMLIWFNFDDLTSFAFARIGSAIH